MPFSTICPRLKCSDVFNRALKKKKKDKLFSFPPDSHPDPHVESKWSSASICAYNFWKCKLEFKNSLFQLCNIHLNTVLRIPVPLSFLMWYHLLFLLKPWTSLSLRWWPSFLCVKLSEPNVTWWEYWQPKSQSWIELWIGLCSNSLTAQVYLEGSWLCNF